MEKTLYRYHFATDVPFDTVRTIFDFALLGTGSLHGEAALRLDARYSFSDESRMFVVDAASPVGASLARLFTGYLREQLGESGFVVKRINGDGDSPSQPRTTQQEVATP